ncbi:FecR family protein [Pontibacter sp. 13R65]|uniref:FecR family protein n=1 Tax=Pontibacter sp. 13R65 TaxID=3127458 RepID=UPI00301C387F
MQPEKEILSNLLEKYLQGKANRSEVELLQKWFWQLDVREQKAFKSFSKEEEIRLKMKRRILEQIKPVATVKKIHYFPTWLQAAAASLLLLIGVFVGYKYLHAKEPTSIAKTVIEADGNSSKKVTLPDGTIVSLNLYSKLELDEDYNEKERKVKLIGEAFFDVKQDSLRPFIVSSNAISTHVLGTAFNVEAYEGEEQIRVALLRGKVKVKDGNSLRADLSPGQMIVYDRAAKKGKMQAILTQHVGSWMQNKIIFDDISLADAIHRIQHHHQLKIQIDPAVALEGKRVTGEFENNKAEQALEAILLLHNMKITKRGNVLFLSED